MRLALVLALCACQQKSQPQAAGSSAPPPPGDASTARAVPPGPYVVAYDCFHSDMPFGKGAQTNNRSYDLGARTLTSLSYALKGDEDEHPPRPGDVDPRKTPPTITVITPEHAAQIDAAVVRVLAGGHFEPENPVPEGTPCTLTITANGKQLFTIEKAYTKQADAVTALVQAL
jgi:hypothetical protein